MSNNPSKRELIRRARAAGVRVREVPATDEIEFSVPGERPVRLCGARKDTSRAAIVLVAHAEKRNRAPDEKEVILSSTLPTIRDKDVKRLIDLVRQHENEGWSVKQTAGRKLCVKPPVGEPIYTGITPGDLHSVKNFEAALRRAGLETRSERGGGKKRGTELAPLEPPVAIAPAIIAPTPTPALEDSPTVPEALTLKEDSMAIAAAPAPVPAPITTAAPTHVGPDPHVVALTRLGRRVAALTVSHPAAIESIARILETARDTGITFEELTAILLDKDPT